MEVSVHANDLAQVLRLVHSVTERRNAVPIPGTISLRADQKGPAISGTDLQFGEICYCPATIEQAGIGYG